MNISASELNKKFKVGDFVIAMFTTNNADMGIEQMVGKLVNKLNDKDPFGNDMYQVEFQISDLPKRVLPLCTASFNIITIGDMAWRINTNHYYAKYIKKEE